MAPSSGIDPLIDDLRSLPAEVSPVDYRMRGYHLEVQLQAGQIRECAGLMRERGLYLVFISAVHLSPAPEILYQFAWFETPCRILVRSSVSADGSLPTISDIFDGANWHERETRDMFGVVFTGHPYLKPLLLPEDTPDLKPLLKAEKELKTADRVRREKNDL